MNKIKKYDLLIVLILVAIYGIYVFDLNRLILDKNLVLVGGDLSFNIFLIKIGMQGYCAILFDKDFSQWQIERQASLDETIGRWPGLRMNLGEPNFDNERYQVFLLTN